MESTRRLPEEHPHLGPLPQEHPAVIETQGKMATRAFDVVDVVEILLHWHAGRSKSEVSRSLDVDRGTVRKYVGRAEAAGFFPGGPPLSREEWAAHVRLWFPELFAPELSLTAKLTANPANESGSKGDVTGTLAEQATSGRPG